MIWFKICILAIFVKLFDLGLNLFFIFDNTGYQFQSLTKWKALAVALFTTNIRKVSQLFNNAVLKGCGF